MPFDLKFTHALSIFGCLLVAACGPGDADDDTGTSTGDTGDTDTSEPTTTGGDPACACIDPAMEAQFSYICEPGPCATVTVKCEEVEPGLPGDALCDGTGKATLDVAALDCALDQLIAGTPGMISFHHSDYISYGGGFVVLGPGEKMLTRSYGAYDLGAQESAAGFVTLKDAAYFTDCKAEADPHARYMCFRDWSDEEPTAVCDDASESSEQI